MDEARVGLIPTYCATWALKGRRPTASSRRRYQWRYLYAFVHPRTGRMFNLIGTTVSTEAMSAVLHDFAREVGAGPARQVVVVLDGAGWHTAPGLALPAGIHLVHLPAYSPELQPAERLFPLVNEALANRPSTTIDQLVATLTHRLAALDSDPDIVSRHTKYHWWPDDYEQAPMREAS